MTGPVSRAFEVRGKYLPAKEFVAIFRYGEDLVYSTGTYAGAPEILTKLQEQ
jgi:hypothetical protein